MFQKPAFGANTSGFGMQSTFGSSATTTTSPFGGFKPAAGTGAFGAPPAFGASAATQPATGGGLFGATNTSGGLFGATAAPAPTTGFGAGSSGFGFGANTSNTGLFNTSNAGTLFPQAQTNTAFGAKPQGFGFGSATSNASTGGLFNTQQAGPGLFGQNNTMSGGGLFSNNAGGFGQQQQPTGTGHVKYNPLVGTDMVVKAGTSQSINIKHHCITCMKEYEGKSLEELRLEDYAAGRKGAPGGVFGFQQQENKPLFGATNAFGQPATTSAPSVFGGGTLSTGGFGQTNTFSFGGNTQANTNTTGLFGAQKPAFGAANTTGTGLFGAPASTQANTFGTNTSTFGFGSNLQNQSTGGLFGAKPATTGFGAAPASTGFGSFGSGGLFGAKPLQTQAPTFGAPQPGVGSMAGGFGTTTSSAGGLFGGSTTFGKPATSAPSFGFGNTQSTLGGMNTGLGANSFAAKPATQAPFGMGGTSFSMQPNNNFRTGLDSGLGGGIFGNNSGLGGSALGLGMNANNSLVNNLSGASAAGNVHEQILTLAARPYGDSPLFKDLLPDSSTTAEDVLKPTNPRAQAAIMALSNSAYRVTSPPSIRLALHPRAIDKKSLFDGLEESDASLEDKLTLKPSRKRLVLRPNHKYNEQNDSTDGQTYRSQESLRSEVNGNAHSNKENASTERSEDVERVKHNIDFANNNNQDISSDRQSSWLNSSKHQWNDKERSADEEPSRLYPSLEKDLPTEVSERRSSWLTTKTLRKPLSSNPDPCENSVRELGVRSTTLASPSQEKENIDTLSGLSKLSFCRHHSRWDDSACSSCEKISHQIGGIYVSEEEAAPRDAPPHPTGVRCTRPGYYTIPSLDEMIKYMRPDGSCVVPHLTIGRTNYGNVYYDEEIDVAGLDIDNLVHFLNKEVIIYPEDSAKPPIGEGLNRRAVVTLDRVWPRDKTTKRPVDDPHRLLIMDYEGKLRRVCDKHDTKFVEYRPQTGSWVFRVEHFSKYGLTDSDEEDDITPEVLKRQLVNQPLQKNAAPAIAKPLVTPSVGLGGLGLSGGGLVSEDTIFAMQQSSINLLNGASKAFEMDTTEDNAESQSLYQDNRVFAVKSPTSELARLENRQSAHVQLMKASLYADTEIEDDISISTGDQLVPMGTMSAATVSLRGATPTPRVGEDPMEVTPPTITEEIPMKPLIVQPHTIVLRYHRKIPPFNKTIAGGLGAACIADMSICRARHSRVGFGPGGALAYATTYRALADLPTNAEMCDLTSYVSGRSEEDWSEPIVARVALSQPDNKYNTQEILSRHLDSLFQYSNFEETEGCCARLYLADEPKSRYAALQQIIRDSEAVPQRRNYGVSGAYCLEVWKLCDALWGLDLLNDGVTATDDASIVNRHQRLLSWLMAAGADDTDEELSKPTPGEKEDENDGHSRRIWTLLLGGRLLEACKVARDHGDLNMAALIAQAHGDPSFRSLIARQLSLWRECGADTLISTYKLAILRLISASPPREQLCEADWKHALFATARYLCPQVPSLETVVRHYEELFSTSSEEEEEVDLAALPEDEMGMRLPLPPHRSHYDVSVSDNGRKRRILDLRYELIRARAFNTRPRLRPASYTPHPLDYSLCFLLGIWFGNPSPESVIGVSEQLEAGGAWHRAIHALCYLPDGAARGHLIRGVLSRHAPARASERLSLLARLRVPPAWVLLARAHRAKYEHLPALEAEHLVGAGQWNAAHKVLLDELLPEAVLADNLQSISPLLDAMSEAASRNEVSGWESGGQALHQYLYVCEEIRGLVSSADGSRDRGRLRARLEALRPAVAAACRALASLKQKSARHRAARAEMGARLLQLAGAGGAPSAQLARLLRALRLPPDCAASVHHKITTELAEQASELCIESSTSSPMSSHHRATHAS